MAELLDNLRVLQGGGDRCGRAREFRPFLLLGQTRLPRVVLPPSHQGLCLCVPPSRQTLCRPSSRNQR